MTEKKKTGTKKNMTAKEGYRRLAFGSCADAFKLVFRETPPTASEIEAMDLFCVSTVRQSKNGGVELSFFDRFEALDRLAELERLESGGEGVAPPFYSALVMGAQAIAAQGGSSDGT